MKKSILEIYALLVCVITLVWALVALGVGIYDCVKIAAPRLTVASYTYSKYLSNEHYRETCCTNKDSIANLTENEVTAKRVEGLQITLDEEQRSGVQSLIQSSIALLLNICVFFVHWKLAQRARGSLVS